MFTCSKCLLHTNFWERIYPSTTHIILTINAVNTRIRFIYAILLAIDINRKLATIHPKLKGITLNLFSRTGNNANRIRDLSTPMLLDAILLAIDINWKLFTIDPKLKGTILNLFIKAGSDLSLAVNSKKFL